MIPQGPALGPASNHTEHQGRPLEGQLGRTQSQCWRGGGGGSFCPPHWLNAVPLYRPFPFQGIAEIYSAETRE